MQNVKTSLIFRYGPWMDTNLVVPLDATRCKVIFDYFLDKSLMVESSPYLIFSFQYILCREHIILLPSYGVGSLNCKHEFLIAIYHDISCLCFDLHCEHTIWYIFLNQLSAFNLSNNKS